MEDTQKENETATIHPRKIPTQGFLDFARDYPFVTFGLLMIPVTYSITQDIGMTLFTGGVVAFGPSIAEGIKDAQTDDGADTILEEPVEAELDE